MIVEAIIQAVISVLFIVCIISIVIFVGIKKVKQSDNDSIPLKKATKVVISLDDLSEDVQTNVLSTSQDSLYDVLDALQALAQDEQISEIILDVDNIFVSPVHLEELFGAFEQLRQTKKIKALATSLDNHKYSIALLADEIYLWQSKQSEVIWRSYQVREPYIAKLLAKFGIRATHLSVGNYKSAGENFLKEQMSDEKRESVARVQDALLSWFTDLVQQRRGVTITDDLANGTYVLPDTTLLQAQGLIDGFATFDSLAVDYQEDTIDFADYCKKYKEQKNKSKNTIAVLSLEGTIQEDGISYESVVAKIEQLEDMKELKGVVLRINSPGGSAMESEKIHQKLTQLDVPIYVSMGDYCASGGYYLATLGQKIYANATTLTGSIGVLLLYPQLSEAIDKLDITIERVGHGVGTDIFDITQPLSQASHEKLARTLDNVYTEFKDHVKKARGMDEETLERLAGGRVWLGTQAKENGLVDEIGTYQACVDALATQLDLADYCIEHIQLSQSLRDMIPDIPSIPGITEFAQAYTFIKQNQYKVMCYEPLRKD